MQVLIRHSMKWSFPGGTIGKEPTYQFRRCKRRRFKPWVRKIPWRREWQPTPVFLPGESMDRGSWQATVHGDAESLTWPKRLNTQTYIWLSLFTVCLKLVWNSWESSKTQDKSAMVTFLKEFKAGYKGWTANTNNWNPGNLWLNAPRTEIVKVTFCQLKVTKTQTRPV